MPELGRVSREQAAALAGLAPFVQQSGRWTGETHIAGGRSRLRPVALVACARKLLVFANTVVARGTPWTERPTAA